MKKIEEVWKKDDQEIILSGTIRNAPFDLVDELLFDDKRLELSLQGYEHIRD